MEFPIRNGHVPQFSTDIRRQRRSIFRGQSRNQAPGFRAALAAIIGQTRFIWIFTSRSGNGNNAEYDIVQFVGIRVMDVNPTGSMNSKHLTRQPAVVYTRGGIQNTSTTTQTSWGIYSPCFWFSSFRF